MAFKKVLPIYAKYGKIWSFSSFSLAFQAQISRLNMDQPDIGKLKLAPPTIGYHPLQGKTPLCTHIHL